jgi:hypothetical protein
MVVVIKMKSGDSFRLDRRYSASEVRVQIADGRQSRSGEFIELNDNGIPTRVFYIDPKEVESVRNDGYSY